MSAPSAPGADATGLATPSSSNAPLFARNLAEAGMKERGREVFKALIEDFPRTLAADEARRMLRNLK